MSRPEVHNAIHPPMHSEMENVWNDYSANSDLWVAILTGEGAKAFSSGNDLKYTASNNKTSICNTGFAGLSFRFDLEKPIIAAVNGFAMGGGTPGGVDINQYVNITTFGNSVDFGKFAAGGRGYMGACASSTRGVVMGGWKPASRPANSANTIEYFTMASSGDTIDFGDLQEEKGEMDCCSSSTRGLTGGGEKVPFANTDTIDYVEISTIGNSIDFGNLTVARRDGGMTASPTRAFLAGGIASATVDTIDMMTISSIGNAIDFGSLTAINYPDSSNASNTTRGYVMGGVGNDTIETIDMFNFSSGGNAIVFGDLTTGARNAAGCSTHIRGLVMGGGNPSAHNTIQYFTLSTSGNAADFGDLSRSSNTASMASCSDSHGGLGGY